MSSIHDQEKSLGRVLRAIDAFKNNRMVIMFDEEDRENEGDIVFPAEQVTPEKINFMAREARGLICLAMEPALINRLKLPMMIDDTKLRDQKNTAFTVSIEARHGVTTGISVQDRATTVKVAVADNASPDDLVVPGHVFPLRAKQGGVLERTGHTEGSVDLAKLAGCKGAAVICEIMNENGSMARMPDLIKMAEKFDLPLVSIPDLVSYRLLQESFVEVIQRKPVLTSQGTFEAVLFKSKVDQLKHFALIKGQDFENQIVDVRVHIQRPLIDVFADDKKGGRFRIEYGLKTLADSAHAVLLYLTRRDSQDDFENEIAEMFGNAESQPALEGSLPPANMDQRLIGTGSQILRALGVKRMRVHSSSHMPYIGLSGFGLEVVDTKPVKLEF